MTALFLWIYQAGLILFGAGYLLARLARGRRLPGLRERLGLYTLERRRALANLDGPIWIHAVSVGEVLAARPLLKRIRQEIPGRGWVMTTVTPTGRQVAERAIRPGQDQLLYLPWDLAPVVRRAIRAIRPTLFLCLETELWPVLLRELDRAKVPIAVVNGRISPRAYRRYLWIRPLMQRALEPVALFLAQSPQDARRLAAIGAAKDRIAVTGNVKWDQPAPQASDGGAPAAWRQRLGLSSRSVLWTAGSTHSGEDLPILQAYSFLREEFPHLRLLVAPRHPERVMEVEQQISAANLKSVRRSALGQPGQGNAASRAGQGEDPVIVLDTLGELADLYRASDLVFIGGSLIPHGGHNLAEPAAAGRPILTGPHLHNFSAIAEELEQAKAMVITRTAKELEEAIRRLLQDPRAAAELGARARTVVGQHQGATDRTAEFLFRRWGPALARR